MSKELQRLLGLLDARLASCPFLLGDDFSLADLIVGCCVTYGTFSGVSIQTHAHVQAWLTRFQARPAYQQTWVHAAG